MAVCHLQVVGRVLGTIVGASLGLGIDYIPDIFNSPVLLLVCLGGACILLGVIARAQARTSVALAILTLLSVSLCTYESACCTPGVRMSIVDVFLGRMGAVSAGRQLSPQCCAGYCTGQNAGPDCAFFKDAAVPQL